MLNEFKDYLILDGYQPDNYYRAIKQFLKETNNQEITEDTIKKYIINKIQTSAPETVNMFIKALKVYLRFIKKEIQVPKQQKTPEKLPDSMTLEFFEKEVIPRLDLLFIKGLKIKTVLYFMFYTGIRVPSEILSIKRKDFDLNNRTVKIYMQKTKRERIIVFPKKMLNLIIAYFGYEHEKENAFNLTKVKVEYMFKQLKPNFPEVHMRSRLFRHSFATHLLRQGADITIVSKLLGHTNIKSTLRYLGTNDVLIKEMYDRYIK